MLKKFILIPKHIFSRTLGKKIKGVKKRFRNTSLKIGQKNYVEKRRKLTQLQADNLFSYQKTSE